MEAVKAAGQKELKRGAERAWNSFRQKEQHAVDLKRQLAEVEQDAEETRALAAELDRVRIAAYGEDAPAEEFSPAQYLARRLDNGAPK